jgi:hypothetical protein
MSAVISRAMAARVRTGAAVRTYRLLSIQLSIDPGIIRHRKGEQRQITPSVNDLQISCRTFYSPSVA